VICPRCFVEDIPRTAAACPKCGFSLTDAERAGTAELPVLPELDQQLRRDLSGQYQVGEMLGRGGMSLVYLAHEAELNRPVALKVLPLQLMHAPDASERFMREAKIAAALDHPHIVPIFRVGATGTFLWYTMKRIRGRSLGQIIEQRQRLPLDEVRTIVEQVGSALHYAHRHGVVHRDIKPANVMIEETSGWALVCDFGVARAFGHVQLTQSGSSLGTPRYMSPEQFESQPVDGRSDQYSLAILTFEALTGTVPFTGESLGELVRKHLLEAPPKLSSILPDAPASVSDALDRAMRKRPDERFPDIAAFVEALGGKARPKAPSGFASSGEERGSRAIAKAVRATAKPDAPTVAIRGRSRAGWWFGAGGLAAAAVVAAVLLKPQASPANGMAQEPARDTGGPVDSTRGRPAETARATPPPVTRPPRQETPERAPGRLFVSSSPSGQVFVDGRLINYAPVMNLSISSGVAHRIEVKRDGYSPYDTTMTLAPGQVVRLTRIVLKEIQ
jgi:predicted Ser/Thr protein kinase